MDLGTWVSLATILVALAGVTGYLSTSTKALREEIAASRAEAKQDLASFRADVRDEFAEVKQSIGPQPSA